MNLNTLMRVSENRNLSFNESIELLDEAFFGRKTIDKIQSAMDAIYAQVMAHPDRIVHGTPVANKLNQAIADTFGFKSVHIYWGNSAGGGNPHTRPSVYIFHAMNEGVKYGKAEQRGKFYDSDHALNVYVQMDQTLFTDCGLTSEEAVAILLHEIGHNFDFSPASIIKGWIMVFTALLKVEDLVNLAVAEFGRPVIMALTNVDTYIQKYIPPIGWLVRLFGKVTFNVGKFINIVLGPSIAVTTIPIAIMYAPIQHIGNILLRKGEVYADSFAASYGYGAEIASGLDKMTDAASTYPDSGPIVNFFSDTFRLDQEVYALAIGGHGSNQKRIIKIMDKLEQDLKDPKLDASTKAALQSELNKIHETYDAMLNVDKKQRDTATHIFRRMVNNWYNGKPYMVIPSLGNEYAK